MSTEHPVPVVIGGASGIGWATAQLMAERGDTVVIADLDGDAANTRAIDLDGGAHTKRYPDIVARIADLTADTETS
ncbi:hypothetical protein ACWCPQ_00910 [Nocardia sp. NPDC001965]